LGEDTCLKTGTYPAAILTTTVKKHDSKNCVLCNERPNETGSYSDSALKHSLESYVAEGKLLKILMDNGEIVWQEPDAFYQQHPEFKAKVSTEESK